MESTRLLVLLSCIISLVITEAYAIEGDDEFRLKISADPNIIFIGGGGVYASGTQVTTEEAPHEFQGYEFQGWKIDGTWAQGNPITVRMDRSHDIVAVYSKTDTNQILIDTIPRIAEVTIDGEIFLSNELPASFDWSKDSKHVISIPLVVDHRSDPLTRYVFDSWKDQSTDILRTIVVEEEGADFIALYKTQLYLQPISEQGNVIGGGWHEKGASVSFELESEFVEDKKNENIRYVFNSWNLGDYQNSASNSLYLLKPATVKANWDIQYKLQLQTSVPGYDLFGTGWYDEGRQVALIAEEELDSQNSDINYVFDRWVSKGPNPIIIPNAISSSTTITMDEPYVVAAEYKKSFRVNVWTPYGSAIGAGFYDDGSTAEITIEKTEVVVDPNSVRKIFGGWDTHGARTMDFGELDKDTKDIDGAVGNQNLLVFIDSPVNITAKWKSQYYLKVISDEADAKGEGWYDVGKLAQISLQKDSIPPGMWSTNAFEKWTGDIDSDSTKARVMMNGPKTVIAEFKEDNTPGIINSVILVGVVAVGAVIYKKTHKSPTFGTNEKKDKNGNTPKSFDQFFNTRKPTSVSQQKTINSVSKPNKLQTILMWLMGKKE